MKTSGAFIITGGSSGLGKITSHKVYGAGFPLALFARNEAELKSTKAVLEKMRGTTRAITVHAVDLRDEKSVEKEIKAVRKEHGSIRCLVNNAGTWTGGKTMENLSRKDIQESLDLNFFTAFNATKAVLDVRQKDEELSIINVGATASLQGWDETGAFCLGKGALRFFSQTLARELGPKGVHVAHLIIDGVLDNMRTHKLNPKTPKDKFIKLESVAEGILNVALQERSCWTFEWDVRPYNENW